MSNMANAAKRGPVSGALSNEEAAALIKIILDNTSTSAPLRVKVPDSPQSLTDLFPVAVVTGV